MMFNKQEQDAIQQAARNNKRKPDNSSRDDLSAYDNMRPGISREPMTENDIPLNYSYSHGSEPLNHDTQGHYTQPPYPEMPPGDTDELLFPGGPSMTEFMSWQKQYPDMYVVDDLPDGNIYIYRTITRYEYKVLQALPNTDPLQREELIIDKCLLFPYISYEDMAGTMAGVISVLAQHILTSSGFVKNSIPRKL